MSKKRKWAEKPFNYASDFVYRFTGRDIFPPPFNHEQRPYPSTLIGNNRPASDDMLPDQTTGAIDASSNGNDTSISDRETEGWTLPSMPRQSDNSIAFGDFMHPTAFGDGGAGAGAGVQAGSTSATPAFPHGVHLSPGDGNPATVGAPSSNVDTGDTGQSAQTGQDEPGESSAAHGGTPSDGKCVRFSSTNVFIDSSFAPSQGPSGPVRKSQTPIPEPSAGSPPDELPLNEQNPGHTGIGDSQESGPHPHTANPPDESSTSGNNTVLSSGIGVGPGARSEEPPGNPCDDDAAETPSGTRGSDQGGQAPPPGEGPSGQSGNSRREGEGGPSGDGRHGGERRQGDKPQHPTAGEGSSRQAPTRKYPVPHTQVISDQAHPSPFLKGTPRAHATLAYTSAGVTARIRISKDNVPFVFPDETLSRFNDSRKPEELDWSELSGIHLRSGRDQDAGIMSLNGLMESLCFEGCLHRKAYLQIKSRRPAARVAEAISSVVRKTSQPEMWRARIVIFIPDEIDRIVFGMYFAGYRLVLNCKGDLKLAERVYSPHNLLQFKFNSEVLAAKGWSAFMDNARREGRDVYVEADSTDDMKSCIRAGVTGIVTDHTRVLDGLCWESINANPDWMNPKRRRRFWPNSKLRG